MSAPARESRSEMRRQMETERDEVDQRLREMRHRCVVQHRRHLQFLKNEKKLLENTLEQNMGRKVYIEIR